MNKDGTPARRRFFQFSLGNILWLTFGILVGFAPLKVWEITHPPADQVLVSLELVEVPPESSLARLAFASPGVHPTETLQDALGALRLAGEAKRITAPTLVAMDRHAATIVVGGEIPIPVAQPDGSPTVEYKKFGTELKVVPSIQRNGFIHLELTATVTNADYSQASPPLNLPSFHTTEFGGEVELQPGQTVALSSPQPKNGQTGVLIARAELVQK